MGRSLRRVIKEWLFRAKFYKLNGIRNEFHVLAYHMVSQQPNGFYPEIALQVFERHMQHVAKNYKVLPLTEIAERLRDGRSLAGCMAITFDDGYLDNYSLAYPVLRKYSLPATVFLTTGCIDSGEAPWFIMVRHAFKESKKDQIRVSFGARPVVLSMRTIQERYQVSERVMKHLKESANDERLDFLDELWDSLEVGSFEALRGMMLGWDKVREMGTQGIAFGAHTVTHPILSRVSSEMAEREIGESKGRIEAETGKPVTAVAYPFGKKSHYDRSLFPVLERLGFSCALTTEGGRNGPGIGAFEINRTNPWEFSLL
jgi:peptidoglycan/xylan/chitin deacetylase (PgdA/CDA1 family)